MASPFLHPFWRAFTGPALDIKTQWPLVRDSITEYERAIVRYIRNDLTMRLRVDHMRLSENNFKALWDHVSICKISGSKLEITLAQKENKEKKKKDKKELLETTGTFLPDITSIDTT